MKTNVLVLICLLFAVFSFGQNPVIPENTLSEIKVTPPTFTGVKNTNLSENISSGDLLITYLKDLLANTAQSSDFKSEGVEVVRFTVTPDGNVTNFKIINSVNRQIDRDVVWALEQTDGMWTPGKNNGTPSEMAKEVSLAFMLENANGETAAEHFIGEAKDYYDNGNSALFEKGNAKKAMKQFSRGIIYLPHDPSLLFMRGLCRYEIGDKEGAIEDWKSGFEHGGIDMSEFETAKLTLLKGYYEMQAYAKR